MLNVSEFLLLINLLAAAKALMEIENLTAEEIVTQSMKIAGDLCVYTNHHTVLEVIEKPID